MSSQDSVAQAHSPAPKQVAILNAEGDIKTVNDAWLLGDLTRQKLLGRSYLSVCQLADGPDESEIAALSAGLNSVLNGQQQTFQMEYARQRNSALQWFALQACALHDPDHAFVVTHEQITAPRRAEQISQTFEHILEFAANEIYLGDLGSTTLSWANKRACDNLGYTRAELLQLGPLEFQTELTQQQVRKLTEDLTAGKISSATLRATHRRKDGSEYPADAHLQIMHLGDRPVMIAQVYDVTQQTDTQRELELARMFLESAPDATVVADNNGTILDVNTQTERLLGYHKSELLGNQVELLIPPRFQQTHLAHRNGYLTDPQVRGMGNGLQLFAQTKDGREIPIEVSLSPIDTGTQMLVAAAIRDITDRLSAEEALKSSEVRYRELFDNATDLIQSFNRSGHVEFVNPAWRNAMGYSAEDLKTLTFLDFVAPQSQEYAGQVIARLQQGGVVNDIRITYLTKSGTELHLEGSASWQIVDGKRMSSRAILHDVTERERQEAVLRAAKEEAEQATAGKSRFLAAASHDLRQPLQALRLYLSVLERYDLTDRQMTVAAKMSSSLDTMSDLLNALLDISRLDSGAIETAPCDMSCRELLQSVFTNSVQQAEEKGLSLQVTGADIQIHTDPGLLARIVENYVTNAIRYTETGGITLNAERCDGGVVISVADTGVGIEADQIDRVFEEYFQLDNQVRDRRKGLGLGLSIVKHIAALLSLPIEVESTPGKGSKFSVIVPLSTTRTTQVGAASPSALLKGQRRVRVLFVDDDPAIVDATTMLLESADIEVWAVHTAEEAIEALQNGQRPDVLISDYRLPQENGLTVIGRARDLYGDDLPVVLISGDTGFQTLEATNIPNVTLLRKPVETNVLIDLIENLTTS